MSAPHAGVGRDPYSQDACQHPSCGGAAAMEVGSPLGAEGGIQKSPSKKTPPRRSVDFAQQPSTPRTAERMVTRSTEYWFERDMESTDGGEAAATDGRAAWGVCAPARARRLSPGRLALVRTAPKNDGRPRPGEASGFTFDVLRGKIGMSPFALWKKLRPVPSVRARWRRPWRAGDVAHAEWGRSGNGARTRSLSGTAWTATRARMASGNPTARTATPARMAR